MPSRPGTFRAVVIPCDRCGEDFFAKPKYNRTHQWGNTKFRCTECRIEVEKNKKRIERYLKDAQRKN